MAASRRDCATRRGGHCVTNTGSGFSCVISTIINREYAGDHWSVTRRYRRFATNIARPFFIVSSAITGRDAATTVLAGASVRLQKEVLSRADTRLRQSVNVHQNKRARCPAESSECRKQVFIYMVHLADRREYRVGGFYMCARCRLAAAYRRYGGFLYLKSLNNEYKLDIQQ